MPELLVYVTAPDLDTAKTIARTVIEKKLAACANILPGSQSIFNWQGKIDETSEIPIVFKTTQIVYPELEGAIVSLHPYECPCILALPVNQGFAPFLDWIRESVKPT